MAVLTEEQTLLRDAARSWTRDRSPIGAFRRMRDSGAPLGYDPAVWREMGEMGWAGVMVPEAYGGSEADLFTMGLLLEETGRTLTASPLLATGLVAVGALLLGGSGDQRACWLPRIADGEIVATLAVDEGPHHVPENTAFKAVPHGSGWTLSGVKTFVLEGMAAHLFIVAARSAGQPGDRDGVSLFLVPAHDAGLSRRALRLADSRGAAIVTFDDVEVGPDALMGEAGKGFNLLDAILDRARAGLAAEMLGSAAQAFETTLEYLKTRTQFGRPIGTFQALQHRAAKMFTELELARSTVEAALRALDASDPDSALLASLAKAKTGEAYHLISNEMVQMHGGVGMTDAYDAGLYLKRARAAEATFGGPAFHRDRYARLQGY
jgi:alkylation response protein AidB-like acyl-CoA dehydrogenase